ncbi:NAD(P)-binding oxidoreductase [Paenibacillus sp. GP183]|uniref:NAD(P)-dependent oxidoreductase n=1 Tax=Paenibacillus sp. GP183 TaxID=1882751 RepID=UPI0008967894|nr:NAD(P)-binding oxidoreductase [Paenibacillus sp. GP183]SEB45972.1 Putative NADH-flavin reductase [Paenibacillus sp. GP183]
MKIIVFGASGATGKEFVKLSLEANHQVAGFVRDPAKLTIQHPNLKIIVGDALQRNDVISAIANHDAVVSCLAAPGLRASSTLSDMTTNLIAGMHKNQMERILYLASAGIHKEISGLAGWLVKLILHNVLADHSHAVALLGSSDLMWTVARPMKLTNTPLTEEYRTAITGIPKGGRKISRSDVAHFLLRSLTDRSYIKQTVGLAY